jgi:hypothetical protein
MCLLFPACSEISIYVAKSLRDPVSEVKLPPLCSFFHSLPRAVAEALYRWVVQSSFLIVKIQTDVDDQVILDEHCGFLARILKIVLHPKMRHLEGDFTIDLRNFKNFYICEQSEDVPEDVHLEVHGLQVTEELLGENSKVAEISQTFAEFLATAPGLETFTPGLFVTDRSQPTSAEPHKMSLCFSSPQVAINLVQRCPLLTTLSLLGYEDLSDIVLEFLSGEHEESAGLVGLESLQLPERSYITEHGVRSLLQRLPRLRLLSFPGDTVEKHSCPGNLGKVFELDWEPMFGPCLKLENFSQMLATSSGGVEVNRPEHESVV